MNATESNWSQSEGQRSLERLLERFVRESCSLAQRQEAVAAEQGFSREHWRFLAEMGVLGLPFGESDGGFGGSLSEVMAVMRLLGRALLPEPYFGCIVLAGRLLERTASETQKIRWLHPLIAGQRLIGLAHLERGDRARGDVTATRLSRCPAGLRIDGAKILVPIARSLDEILVSARDERGVVRLCVVRTTEPGISIRSYRCVDGNLAGDVAFDGVVVGPDALLAAADAEEALGGVLDYADAVLCAEAVGSMQALLEMTIEHTRTRKQFGRPLGSFQALKHRLVDCHASVEQALGLLELAACEHGPGWRGAVAAARAFIGEHATRLGHEAIQMHGGMGLTDELAVSHHHKRLVMNAILFGDRLSNTDRYLACSPFVDDRTAVHTASFESFLMPEEREFREEVRAFLAHELDEELRCAVRRQTSTYADRDVTIAWQKRLNARGWLAPHWPLELGGTGWTPVKRFLFEYECAVAGAPEQVPMGFRYVGPVIAHFGSAWQKEFFLPKLLASEHYWAQGFSEPGAGSDLAAITTTAVRDGNCFVINGSKMWTTHAHHANWLFCLARTSRPERLQQGISFFLVDMCSPGITVAPIRLLTADHEVNQVFLDNVRVPAAHLVGEEGRGWEYAKFLLEFERGGSVFCGRLRHEYGQVRELVDVTAPQLWRMPAIAQQLASLEHRLLALEMLEYRAAVSSQQGMPPGVGGSLRKLLASELQKDITEAGMHVAGYRGLELEPARPLAGPLAPQFPDLDLAAVAMPRYLNMRVASIYGGSSEIQREIIAKHVLGLR